ncbi:MAG: cren protein [Thermofilaceae archaeon]
MISEKAVCIKLKEISDLARLASALVTMTSSVYLIHFSHNGKHYYGLFATFRDYYRYYGIPILYYVERDEPLKGKYLAIKVDENGERVESLTGVRAGWICVPIVSLDRKPDFIDIEV